MRILSLVTQLEAGGAQTVAFDVADELRTRGHEASLCFFYEKRPAYADRTHFEVLSEERPRTFMDSLQLLRQLSAKLRRERPDAVICYTHYANVIGALAASLAGVPIRIVSHQNPRDSYPAGARWADTVLGALGVYSAAAACSTSVLASFEGVSSAYRRRLVVAPNGIRARAPRVHSREARLTFKLPLDVPLALAAGRLAPQKNHLALIRAVAQVEGLHLAVAGEGELREALVAEVGAQRLAGRVHFLGQVAPDLMPELFAAADVFAMPSLFEGLSLVLVEAMHAGLPIVASDIPSMTDVLRTPSGDSGLLVPVGSDEELAGALSRLATDAALRRQLGASARARAEDFLVSRTASAYEQLLLQKARA